MSTTSMTIRLDTETKAEAQKLFSEIGLDMTTAVLVFLRQAIRQQSIPFELTADPFYSKRTTDELLRRAADAEAGQGMVRKTIAELEAMENE